MNGLFGVNGLFGFLIAVLLVVALAAGFGLVAAKVQKNNAQNYYHIKDIEQIQSKNPENRHFFEDADSSKK